MSREYDAYCASLNLETFNGRNALRCLHFRRWFPELRKNHSELVQALGFQDWHFIQHHADCDREAVVRAKAIRALCPMNQECKHKGYRKTYPLLDGKISRRRKCFRILPSQRRHDITDQIDWEGRLVRRVADWTPLMRLMFAEPPQPSRKSKRQPSNEESAPLRWSKSMRRTLDRVELLGVAFTDEPGEMALMTELFGFLSVEAESLRCIRDTVRPPPPRAAEVPNSVEPSEGGRRNRPEKKIKVTNMAHVEETTGANGDKTPDVSVGETSQVVPGPEKKDLDIVIRAPRFAGDEDWLGAQDRLRPPTKRPRTIQLTKPFPYTRRPNVDDLTSWRASWSRFYKAQEMLKRMPGADMSKHTIPARLSAKRGKTAAPGPSQDNFCDSPEEYGLVKYECKRKDFQKYVGSSDASLETRSAKVDDGDVE